MSSCKFHTQHTPGPPMFFLNVMSGSASMALSMVWNSLKYCGMLYVALQSCSGPCMHERTRLPIAMGLVQVRFVAKLEADCLRYERDARPAATRTKVVTQNLLRDLRDTKARVGRVVQGYSCKYGKRRDNLGIEITHPSTT